jgi:hypothetical protein
VRRFDRCVARGVVAGLNEISEDLRAVVVKAKAVPLVTATSVLADAGRTQARRRMANAGDRRTVIVAVLPVVTVQGADRVMATAQVIRRARVNEAVRKAAVVRPRKNVEMVLHRVSEIPVNVRPRRSPRRRRPISEITSPAEGRGGGLVPQRNRPVRNFDRDGLLTRIIRHGCHGF